MTKPIKSPQIQTQKPAHLSPPSPATELTRLGMGFAPTASEVARRAYFSYVNQGSHHGQDMRHWLEAESQLISERDLANKREDHNLS